MKIVAISGSLRASSVNTAFLEAVRSCAPAGMTVERFKGLGDLPIFNPDLEDTDPLPAAVVALRAAVSRSDGLLICSPEYARGVSGAIKNGLDWLVGGDEFADRPVAIVNTSKRATVAFQSLRLILETMGARILDSACVTAPLSGRRWNALEIAEDPDLRLLIRHVLTRMQRDILVSEACGRSGPAA
ncbi:MAG: NAD(P)H-dependent oxidoreductase [Brevundimonas sp.]|nr:MAG: NAD(P)H-dependent oxidoreductase [Brevundimonas sp.]